MTLLAALRPERLRADLARYRAFGAVPGGGVERPALGDADWAARAALEADLGEAGLRVEVDRAGNIWGHHPSGSGPAVVSGSHLDSVPRGGYLDGPLGVLAPLEVARAMRDAAFSPTLPFSVVCFTGEEGSRFRKGTLGSAVAAGTLPLAEAEAVVDFEGRTFGEVLRARYQGRVLTPIPPASDRFRSFVELHIEQGGILEHEGKRLGVVDAIAGLTQLLVDLEGVANHAGTTPMTMRQDALAAAAEVVLEVERSARATDGGAVATVGKLEVSPGGLNVIPGHVHLTVDMRSASALALSAIEASVRDAIGRLSVARGIRSNVVLRQKVEPCPMDRTLSDRVQAACERTGHPVRRMNSGAVHDALKIGAVVPSTMIFVPSVGGKSHTPEEETRAGDLAVGLLALAAAIGELCGPGSSIP